MMKKSFSQKKLLTAVSIIAMLLTPLLTPVVHAQTPPADPGKTEVCSGIGGCGSQAQSDLQLAGVVQAALNIVSIVIGIAGVLMVMLGGFRYITAGGDASKTSSAQNTILWALVGLAIAATAQIIVRFVLNRI